MVELSWMSLEGPFRCVAVTHTATVSDAVELARSVYPDAELVSDDESGCFRITSKGLGKRAGRNVVMIDDSSDDW